MVTTASISSDGRERGAGYDGVVRITYGSVYATGVLLHDGRTVLTAAHLVTDGRNTTNVLFETQSGDSSILGTRFLVHPEQGSSGNNDLALIWLSQSAPVDAERYALHRDPVAASESFEFVGYGRTGLGSSGYTEQSTSAPVRLTGQNMFDATAEDLLTRAGALLSWQPQPGSQLLADFDNGLMENDAFAALLDKPGLGLGSSEALIAPGDSGGPAFVDSMVAGIATYTARLSAGDTSPDIDDVLNSSFGEFAAWQNIPYFQRWIDQAMRDAYFNAPTTPEDVRKELTEGDVGTIYAYFLVSFTGLRSNPDQVISVEYTTRDGTARAGEDYIAVSGRLNIYSDEDHAVIPVEIIGDRLAEVDEVFHLDITNPVGGSFGPGLDLLTASRTILDDDGF